MIDIKTPDEESLKIHFTKEQEKAFLEFIKKQELIIAKKSDVTPNVSYIENTELVQELHEISKTLKGILEEMRKQKV